MITEEQKQKVLKALRDSYANLTAEHTTEKEFENIIEAMEIVKNLIIPIVSTRTFRFSGMRDGEKFVKEIQAPDRESAIADFELSYPDLTWLFSTDIT